MPPSYVGKNGNRRARDGIPNKRDTTTSPQDDSTEPYKITSKTRDNAKDPNRPIPIIIMKKNFPTKSRSYPHFPTNLD